MKTLSVVRQGSRAALLLGWCVVSACGGGGRISPGAAGIPARTQTQHVSVSLSIGMR